MSRLRELAHRSPVAGGVVVLTVAVFAVLLLGRPLPAAVTVAVADLGQLAAAGCASVCCLAAAWQTRHVRTRWAWALLAGGTAAWTGGQGVWTWYELVGGRAAPFPSLADVGYLAFPVLAGAALLVLPTGAGGTDTSGFRVRDLLDGLIIAGSLLVMTWATSLGAALSAGGPDRLAAALSVAYPLSDVVLITLVLLVSSRATGGRRAVLALLVAGLLCLAAADSAFVYLTSTGSYNSGDVCDLGWLTGFALVALAATTATTTAGDVAGERAGVPSWLRLVLPYLPLLFAEAVVVGQLLTGDGHVPAPEIALGLGLIAAVLGRQFLTVADNRQLLVQLHAQHARARHQALHDPLTGLANRTLFHDQVQHALTLQSGSGTPTSVLFCDVDDFKTVNDSLGHAAGDALLIELAARLRSCVRAGDTVARLGGDEFAVLIERHDDPPGDVAGRLIDAVAAPLTLNGLQITVSVSVGLASTAPPADEGLTADALLRRADVAMYTAKGRGKATWTAYDAPQTRPSPPAAPPVRTCAALT